MESSKETKTVKVLVLGAENVGKSSLIRRLVGMDFQATYKPIVSDVSTVTKSCKSGYLLFQITELSGRFLFTEMSRTFIQNNDIFMLVYSVDDQDKTDSLKGIKRMTKDIVEVKKTGSVMNAVIVVGNKSDCVQSNLNLFVKEEMEANGSDIVTSAKTGYNVSYLFDMMLHKSMLLNPINKKKSKLFPFL